MVSMGMLPSLAELFIELHLAIAAGLLQPEAGTRVKHTTTSLSTFANVFASAYRHSHAA